MGAVQSAFPALALSGGTISGNLAVTGALGAGATTVTGAETVSTNLTVGAASALGDNGVGELQIAPATTVPTTNPASGVVLFSTANHVMMRTTSGAVPILGGTVQSVVSTTTIANSLALTALQSYTVPANDPVIGSIYEMTGYGVYSVTGTPTLTFALYWGGIAGTAIAAVPAITAATGITNAPFFYRTMVVFSSTTSCTAMIKLDLDTSATTDLTASYVATPTAASTVTTTATSALTMGFTWSAASALNTISLLGGSVQLIR